ncbi:MAG: transcription antiterminator, partial [Acidimicrobiia bacterium]|nr:transcription antiterminator [Acidimicrobiia bacterium]
MMRWLLGQDEPRSTSAMATDLGLSQRVIRYRLPGVERVLKNHGLALAKKRGVGISIDGDPQNLQDLTQEIQEISGSAPRVFARDERFDLLRAKLLSASPAAVSLEQLHDDLQVSRTSARRDAKRAEPWLEHQGLVLSRKPGVGLQIVGPELSVRRAIVKLILEVVPGELLRTFMARPKENAGVVRLSAGMTEFLEGFPLQASWRLAQAHHSVTSTEAEIMLPVFLATTAARMKSGQRVAMEAGQLRSLLDHPVAENARLLANDLGDLIGVAVTEEDVAAIAELVLGLVSLQESFAMPVAPQELVTKMLEVAASRLHPILEDDPELRRGLSQHLERLVVRLRYNLPVHNPLLAEVSERYPEVHTVARDIALFVGSEIGANLPEDEVGFITMYLSGAMERTHLWPRRRAIVVCPSGVATAWILVSRIQAEFPQLDL